MCLTKGIRLRWTWMNIHLLHLELKHSIVFIKDWTIETGVRNILTREIRGYAVIIFWLIILCIMLTVHTTNNDTLFHIKVGETLVSDGFTKVDSLTTHDDLRYLPYAYGFDILTYVFYNLFGFGGIVFIKYFSTVAIGVLLLYCFKKLSVDRGLNLAITGVTLVLLSFFLVVRPQIVSYVAMIIQLYIYTNWQSKGYKSKTIWLIPCLFLILTNFHMGTSIFHILISGTFLFDIIIIKYKSGKPLKDCGFYTYIIIFALSLVALCINPYFPDHLLFSFKTLGDSDMMFINEWKSPELLSYNGVVVLVSLVIFAKTYSSKKAPVGYLLTFIGSLILAIRSIRFLPYLIIISAFSVGQCMVFSKEKFYKFRTSWITTVILGILSLALFIGIDIKDGFTFDLHKDNPVEVVEYLIENNITEGVYNDYNIGAYLMFHDIKVFIDQRADLYSKSFNGTSILNDSLCVYTGVYNIFEILDKYELNYAIIDKNTLYYNAYVKESGCNILVDSERYLLIETE